ncbi:hypothetical protein V6N13_033870 [Hibiscus sabdariffa]
MNSMEMVRMWKGNKVEYWRVIETTSWMAEEDIEIIHRDEELRCNAVNLWVVEDWLSGIIGFYGPCVVADQKSAWLGLRKEVVTDSLVFKMRNLKMMLKEWNRESFGNMDEKYRLIVAEIKELVARLDNRELGSSELKRKRSKNRVREGILGSKIQGNNLDL